jgi:hypothetical protein
MPRAALLSIHARVADTKPDSWADPALVQLWGPRFSTYAVPARDHAIFSLGRLGTDARRVRVAEQMAAAMKAFLGSSRMSDRDVGGGLGVGNGIRYAGPTGTILIRWEGARAPTIWTVPRPVVDPREAMLELGRRYLHFFGPTTAAAFAKWAGIGARDGTGTFDGLNAELVPVATPIGDGWILRSDEAAFRAPADPDAPARFLPSGDTYFLLQDADRELLLPDPAQRAALWTTRVWPGALLVGGEIAGTWRRADERVSVELFRPLETAERAAVEAEAASMPLPNLKRPTSVRWPDEGSRR